MIKKSDIHKEIKRIAGDSSEDKQWLLDILDKELYTFMPVHKLHEGLKGLDQEEMQRFIAEANEIKHNTLFYWMLTQIEKDACARMYFDGEIEKGKQMLYTTSKMRKMIEELTKKKTLYKPLPK